MAKRAGKPWTAKTLSVLPMQLEPGGTTTCLLAQALDAQNAVVNQNFVWDLRRHGAVLAPPADHYEVSVWSFDVMQSGCGAC